MTRPRKTDRHLPACVYRKHGGYWLVKKGKWTRLGADLSESLAAYARQIESSAESVTALLARALDDAEERVAPSTLRLYRTCAASLSDAFREFRVDQVEPKHVARVMDHWRHKPNMANRARTLLKLAFDQAVRSGMVMTNPVTAIKPHGERKRDRYINDLEYDAIYAEASPPLRCIMDLCYLTAQRIGDVLSIRIADLTADGIAFAQQKTGKKLLIEWSPDLRNAIDAARSLLPERKIVQIDGGGYLLGQRNGRKRSYTGVRDQWARACDRAGIKDAHLHDLRAKSLTDADKQGLNAKTLAGHTTQQMTDRYLRDRLPDVVVGPTRRRKG